MRQLILMFAGCLTGVLVGHLIANWKQPEPSYDIKCYYQEMEVPCRTTPV